MLKDLISSSHELVLNKKKIDTDRDPFEIFKQIYMNYEDVIGSAAQYEYKDGKIIRTNTMLGGLALGPGKPEHIFARTGRLPLFAGGNGDVDIEMLETAKFALFVNHDDDDREYVYNQGAEKSLGW